MSTQSRQRNPKRPTAHAVRRPRPNMGYIPFSGGLAITNVPARRLRGACGRQDGKPALPPKKFRGKLPTPQP